MFIDETPTCEHVENKDPQYTKHFLEIPNSSKMQMCVLNSFKFYDGLGPRLSPGHIGFLVHSQITSHITSLATHFLHYTLQHCSFSQVPAQGTRIFIFITQAGYVTVLQCLQEQQRYTEQCPMLTMSTRSRIGHRTMSNAMLLPSEENITCPGYPWLSFLSYFFRDLAKSQPAHNHTCVHTIMYKHVHEQNW